MYAGRLVECASGPAAVRCTGALRTRRRCWRRVPRLRGPQSARLESIAGQPPRPGEVFAMGCAFASRCPQADEHCHDRAPRTRWSRRADVRTVACHRPIRPAIRWWLPTHEHRVVAGSADLSVALPSPAASAGAHRQACSLRSTDVSLSLPAGGPPRASSASPGSGKSTLARVVLGFVRRPQGSRPWGGRTGRYPVRATVARMRDDKLQVVFPGSRSAASIRA
jgi:oligopeptide/dipeptide ABC transporter ATP-binding protein